MIVDTLSTFQIVPSLSRLKVWQDRTQQERTPPPPSSSSFLRPHHSPSQSDPKPVPFPPYPVKQRRLLSPTPNSNTIVTTTAFVPPFQPHPSRLPTNTIAIPSTLTPIPWPWQCLLFPWFKFSIATATFWQWRQARQSCTLAPWPAPAGQTKSQWWSWGGSHHQHGELNAHRHFGRDSDYYFTCFDPAFYSLILWPSRPSPPSPSWPQSHHLGLPICTYRLQYCIRVMPSQPIAPCHTLSLLGTGNLDVGVAIRRHTFSHR